MTAMSYEFEPACRRMEWLDPFYKSVWEKAYQDAIPISGTFELTPRCNFTLTSKHQHPIFNEGDEKSSLRMEEGTSEKHEFHTIRVIHQMNRISGKFGR